MLLYVAGGFGPSAVAALLVHRGRAGEARSDFWRRVWDVRRIPIRRYAVLVLVGFGPSLVGKLGPDPIATEIEGGGVLAATRVAPS